MWENYLQPFKRLLIVINLGLMVLYLLACLVPFIDTGENWFIALAGLGFTILFFSLVLFIILFALSKSKWFWVSLIILLLGFQQIRVVFAFHFPKKFSSEKGVNTLRVMQWNVSSWDEENKIEKHEERSENFRQDMMNLVQAQNADVLCFEEFFESKYNKYFKPNISTIENMGFPYHIFVPTVIYRNDYQQGIAIFSKFPIIDTASFSFSEEDFSFNRDYLGEHLLYADIKVNDKIFRVFSTHMQSVHFEKSEYLNLSMLKQAKDPGIRESRTILSKLKKGYEFRYKQGQLVKQKIAESPYPSIICGDFNDVPSSNTYFNVRGNLQDAFLQKGSGIGRTFRFISPTLRIDYILVDKKFKVNQFQTIHVPYSDHYPVEADLQY